MKDRSSDMLKRAASVRVPTDYPWKLFASLTQDLRHCFTDNDLKYLSSITRSRDLDKLNDLSEAWGPQSMASTVTSLNEFRAKLQMSSLLKKFRFNSSASLRKTAALKKFIEAEHSCREYNTFGYVHLELATDPRHSRILANARTFIRRAIGDLLPPTSRLRHWSRHGPGANLDCQYGFTSLYDKYSAWPYSCSSGALGYARLAIMDDERWLGALEDSYRERYNVPKYMILDQELFWSTVLKPCDANRITFVPKNARTDRSIAIEPSLNLYLQLGVDGFIRRRLRRFGVDLDDQEKNQRLAFEGSLYHESTDPFVTLDLAAASDTVSTAIVRSLFPEPWYNYLMSIRSPKGVVDGVEISYEKISSMGNGYTFALESLIFTSLCYGVMKEVRGHFNKDDFAVFGDDLIVRQSESSLLIDMLQLSGFSINKEKSFIHGPFRESCGKDYWSGEPVRPVFLTEPPRYVSGLWNDLNRIRKYLYTYGLVWESQTCDLISSWIPTIFSKFRGPISDTEFDTYEHMQRPLKGRDKHGSWKFRRLIFRFAERKGRSTFLFRKLMSTLRSDEQKLSPWSSKSWGGVTAQTGGNVFTLHDMKQCNVSVSPTQVFYWPELYNEQLLWAGEIPHS